MRGHTQLPMGDSGLDVPAGRHGGTRQPHHAAAGRGAPPGAALRRRPRRGQSGRGVTRRGAEPPRIASAADGRRCGGRRGTRGSKHRRGAAQGPARPSRPPPGLLSAPTPASGPPPPRPRPRASVQPRGESSSAGRGGGQQHAEGGGERPGLRDPQEGPGRPRPTYTSARRRPPAPARPPAPGL